jgi:hypothetical protein
VIPVASGLDILFAMQNSTSTKISADYCLLQQKPALFQRNITDVLIFYQLSGTQVVARTDMPRHMTSSSKSQCLASAYRFRKIDIYIFTSEKATLENENYWIFQSLECFTEFFKNKRREDFRAVLV